MTQEAFESTTSTGGCPVDHASGSAATTDGARNPGRAPSSRPTPDVPHWSGRAGHWSGVPGAARLAWSINYGLSTFGLNVSSRRGDPIARLTTDPTLRADPYPGYEALRPLGPMITGRVVRATVDHAVAKEVLRSPDFGTTGTSKPMPGRLTNAYYAFTAREHLGPVDAPSMLAVDGPLHLRYRRLVTRAFAARSVAQQEDQVREVATELLDQIQSEGLRQFDLVERYAGLLPIAVIADMLGVGVDDRRRILGWGDGAALMLDPDLSWKQYRRATRDVAALHHWLEEHVRTLRRRPDDSLLGRLVQLDGDERLDDIELRGVALLLLGAGFETTVNLISNSVALLDAYPEQRWAAAMDGWGGVVDESLRFEPPVQLTFRIALRDTEVAGRTFHEGEAILPIFGGANRDPQVFDDPGTFDVSRSNAAEHLSLSHGAHYCIGANLARLEGKIALEALYERFPNLEVRPGARRRPNRVLRGWETLPVRV